MEVHIKKAVKILEYGGIVIFPTDTAFGIGCRIDDQDAIKKLFSIRRRPASQAMPILCSSVEMTKEYVSSIPKSVTEELMDKYWPGALTIILPANIQKVPVLVRGGGVTVGVRIPKHKTALSLISSLGVPILGSSANFHRDPTPYQFADVNPQLLTLADYAVPGVCTLKKESTVIDCSEEKWKIVRQGAIDIQY